VKYGSRSNSGEVVFTFNPSGTDPQQIIQQHTTASGLTIQHADQKAALLKSYKYMFQKQADKAAGRLITGTISNKGFNNTVSIPNNLTKMDKIELDYFSVLSDLIDDMAEKLQASLGVEEFTSLCTPSQVG